MAVTELTDMRQAPEGLDYLLTGARNKELKIPESRSVTRGYIVKLNFHIGLKLTAVKQQFSHVQK
jgi:hypothetical protein